MKIQKGRENKMPLDALKLEEEGGVPKRVNDLGTSSLNQVDENNVSLTKQRQKKDKKSIKKKSSTIKWTIKITVITLILALIFSFASEYAGLLHYSVSIILLILLMAISIVCDAIGVAVTSCDPEPIHAMASRKEPASRQALLLVSNAEKVSNICCDVIGDICGIVSGACLIIIITKMTVNLEPTIQLVSNIVFSSIVAAITVGGKALMKDVAVNKSKNLVMITAKLMSIFYKPRDNSKRRKRK
ncbi:MAG TPA: hypothetical protein PKX91_00210 [Clostridia bacterium]|nr:hypothetical protein [Clostridia bacterium]